MWRIIRTRETWLAARESELLGYLEPQMSFSALRQRRLRGLDPRLGAGMGVRAATPQPPTCFPTTLLKPAPGSSPYQRDNRSPEANELAGSILTRFPAAEPGYLRFLVNSKRARAQLCLASTRLSSASTVVPKVRGATVCKISDELFVLDVPRDGLSDEQAANMERSLARKLDQVGATPSVYVLQELLNPARGGMRRPPGSTGAKLGEICGSPAFRALEARANKRNAPCATLCLVATQLVSHLKVRVEAAAETKFGNPAIPDILKHIENCVALMAAYVSDLARCSEGYLQLHQEIYAFLQAQPLYTRTDFNHAFVQQFGDIPGTTATAYPMWSGMDALSAAEAAARKAVFENKGKRETVPRGSVLPQFQGRTPNYFEHADTVVKSNPSGPFVSVCLNVSDPVRYDASRCIVDEVQHAVRNANGMPVCLMVDITIEYDSDEAVRVLRPLFPYISKGELFVFLCKSLQKFSSFASGKVMAGCVVFISRGQRRRIIGFKDSRADIVRQFLENETLPRNDVPSADFQYVTHLRQSAPDAEYLMAARACENAQHIRTNMKRPDDGIHSPFVGFSADQFVRTRGEGAKNASLVYHQNISCLDTFPGVSTSYLLVSNSEAQQAAGASSHRVRLAAGQETPTEVIEKTFAANKLFPFRNGDDLGRSPASRPKFVHAAELILMLGEAVGVATALPENILEALRLQQGRRDAFALAKVASLVHMATTNVVHPPAEDEKYRAYVDMLLNLCEILVLRSAAGQDRDQVKDQVRGKELVKGASISPERQRSLAAFYVKTAFEHDAKPGARRIAVEWPRVQRMILRVDKVSLMKLLEEPLRLCHTPTARLLVFELLTGLSVPTAELAVARIRDGALQAYGRAAVAVGRRRMGVGPQRAPGLANTEFTEAIRLAPGARVRGADFSSQT